MTTTDTRATADAGHGGTVRQGVDYLPMEQDTYTYARMYAARGWSLVALHWVTAAGQCSCGTVGCKSAGKHPRGKEWQQRSESPERWLRGDGTVLNIGIRTGEVSGFWVLDYDPADADDAGRALFDELTAVGHMRPPHVRTGGGGFHWRFRMPGFPVRNRQSAGGGGGRTHRLPAGWDVRGDGGQVVAPPSVSAKGAYVELGDAAAYEAPAWLLELIRPVERDAPPNHTVSTALPTSLRPEVGGPEGGAEVGRVEGSSHSAEQVQAYANRALSAELSEYESTADGRRGEPAFAFACNLVEIANLARWPLEAVYPYFEASSLRAGANAGGGGYAPHELPGQWQRAIEHVGGRARVMPPGPEVVPGFSLAGAAVPAAFSFVDPGTGSGGAVAADGVTRVTATTPGPDLPVDPWTRDLQRAVYQQDVREAAQRFRLERDAAARPPLETELLTGDTLDSVADPVPVVDGWLFADSLARLNGRPGQGKSFVAIDLACSVATGTPWHGNAVRQGPVLLIVAEGVAGVRRRVRAWEASHGRKVGDALIVLPRAVQVTSPEWARLVALAAARGVVMAVVDTQARVTAGLNENLSADMGLFVQALEQLRAATGACVLTVHHKGKGDGEGGRGSNAVEGAMVSEFDVWKSAHTVTVKNTKQKDIEGGYKLEFTLQAEGDSAVLVQKVEFVDAHGTEEWKAQAIALYEILRAHSGAAGITEAEAKKQAAAKAVFHDGKAPRTVTNLAGYAWNNLIMRGLLIRHVESKRFGVHVMERTGEFGVLTPNVGEHQVADPAGWQTYAPDAVDPSADWTVNLGKSGGKRVSAAIAKM